MDHPDNMVYYNTRVRAMKSALLSREQFEELLGMGDVQRIIEFMLSSPYEEDIAESLTRYEGADAVEDAASRNLVRTYQRLLGFAQGDFKALAAAFLDRWDLAAVKALLRAKHQGLDTQTALDDVPPGPTLTVALIRDLLDRDSMDAVLAGLAAWNRNLVHPLTHHLSDYLETRNVAVFEEALDRRYFVETVKQFRQSADANEKFLVRVLQMEIDRINLRTVFQAKREQDQGRVEERLLPYGTLSREALMKILQADNAEQAAEILGASSYRDLSAQLVPYLEAGRFSGVERLFEKHLTAEIQRLARADVFSVAVLMHYAWLKYNEVLNLRLIARGASRHLPQARVREELVYA